MQLIDSLNWRYATKKFDPAKKVSDKDVALIKEAVRLSAASYGLQNYVVLDIGDKELRESLQPLSWGQSQVVDASHLFVFCNYLTVGEGDVEEQMQLKSKVHQKPLDAFAGYGDFVKGKIKEKPSEDLPHWTAKQTYIALANAMAACAELRIDCTPMEGFDAAGYDQKLDLTEQGLTACALLAIGYRHADDAAQHGAKVRKEMNSIFRKL